MLHIQLDAVVFIRSHLQQIYSTLHQIVSPSHHGQARPVNSGFNRVYARCLLSKGGEGVFGLPALHLLGSWCGYMALVLYVGLCETGDVGK